MSAAIQTLTNAKEALDADLITRADFDTVKDAFLRAQQLKAGLDAGFILEADYQHVKHAFFDSLRIGSAPAAASALNHGSAPLPSRPSGTEPHTAPSSAATSRAPSPPPPPPSSAPPPSPAQLGRRHSHEAAQPPQQPDAGARGLQQLDSFAAAEPPAAAGERFEAPTNVPVTGGARRRAQNTGKSIAGIDVEEDAVNLYYFLKAKSTYRWATWKINPEGTKVIIAHAGDKQATFADLLSCLPAEDCRYAVFDYQFTNSDGFTLNKIIFISWAPEVARVKKKMMYASTKDFFKGFLDGLSVEVQASGLDDLKDQDIEDSVRAATTRA